MEFVNLTSGLVIVEDAQEKEIARVEPNGPVAFTTPSGDVQNLPDPADETVYLTYATVAGAVDRDDVLGIDDEQTERDDRGRLRAYHCVLESANGR